MKAVIIGAGGFVGSRLASIMLAEMEGLSRLTLMDQAAPVAMADPRVTVLAGDFGDPALLASALDGADKVVLLASILGGAAEANYALSRRVNVDATLNLLEHMRDHTPEARLVFASTIAVFGKPMPALVTDTTPTGPSMIYGAQKLMLEVAIANFATREWLDGLSIRPAGVMARDGADSRLKSAFMSRVFYAVMRGEDIVLPVHPHSRTWLTSVDNVARNFLHAAMLEGSLIGRDRAFTLPALALTFEELVAALKRRFPESRAKVTYAPDEDLVGLFGSYPALETPIADRLGFPRDRDADALVANAFC